MDDLLGPTMAAVGGDIVADAVAMAQCENLLFSGGLHADNKTIHLQNYNSIELALVTDSSAVELNLFCL
ncbi:hypothetical protein ACJIZ3_000892 [Penstemon smallii]|uniref:Uncharacterized protein n=1 Tax=Penstemon smallii TaxID=265156 RepID=A0ABD3U207_9LAMI